MLDRDLAELYNTETKVLNQAVKRNLERFPTDFMFKLTNRKKWTGHKLWPPQIIKIFLSRELCFYWARRCNAIKCFKK